MTVETEEQELVEEMAGGIPGETGAIITGLLVAHVYPKKLGRVFNSQTDFEIPGIGKKQPDVAFIKLERLPTNTFDTVPMAPDLAVEVVSKTDDLYNIEDKVFDYLKGGVKLVWLVRPKHQLVEVYQSGERKPSIFGIDDELDGGSVLPGFRLKLSELFV